MKHIKKLCLLVVLVSAQAGWTQDLVSHADLSTLNYYNFWQAKLPLEAGDTVQDLHRVDENLYAITDQAVVYAIHADVGTVRWSSRMGGPSCRVFRPTHVRSFWGKDLAIITTSDKIEWIDRGSGEMVARKTLDFVPCAAAVSDGVRVFVAGLDSLLHCYQFVPSGEEVRVIERWRIHSDGLMLSTPVLWSGGLYLASQDGRLRACDARDKTRMWVFNARAGIHTDIQVDSTGVYFGAEDRCVHKLDPLTGRSLWRFRTPGRIASPPALVGTLLIQEVQEHGVYAIDTDTHEQVWHAPTGQIFISSSGDLIHLLTRNHDVIAVNSNSVQVEQQVPAPGVVLVARNVASPAMYLGNRTGGILCAQPRNVPYLRFEEVQAVAESVTVKPPEQTEPPAATSVTTRPPLIELLRSRSDVVGPSGE